MILTEKTGKKGDCVILWGREGGGGKLNRHQSSLGTTLTRMKAMLILKLDLGQGNTTRERVKNKQSSVTINMGVVSHAYMQLLT